MKTEQEVRFKIEDIEKRCEPLYEEKSTLMDLLEECPGDYKSGERIADIEEELEVLSGQIIVLNWVIKDGN